MTWLAIFLIVTPFLTDAQIRIKLNREEVPLKAEDIKFKPRGTVHQLILGQVPQTLRSYQHLYYYGYVRIGTPGDLVRVVFDTGSPSLWVYSATGFSHWLCIPCWFHKRYHHSSSSTYVADGRPVEINYVSGSMRGYLSQDVLRIGELACTVKLAEATRAPLLETFGARYDGVLGLSPCSGPRCDVFNDLPSSPINPILEQLAQPVFSVHLNREGRGHGEIMFGGTNPQLYHPDTLIMHNTSSPYAWTLTIESIWIGDNIFLNYTTGVEAFIDTGTSLIVGPPSDVERMLRAMDLSTDLLVQCDRINQLPSISFVIGGQKYTLNSEHYASLNTKTASGRKLCYHGLQPIDIGGWILGDVFLSNFYTVFQVGDHSASKIGFAQLKFGNSSENCT